MEAILPPICPDRLWKNLSWIKGQPLSHKPVHDYIRQDLYRIPIPEENVGIGYFYPVNFLLVIDITVEIIDYHNYAVTSQPADGLGRFRPDHISFLCRSGGIGRRARLRA